MNQRNIRLKTQMMDSLDDLIGLTITETDGDSYHNIIICGDKAVLTIKEEEYGSCGGDNRSYFEISTDPIGELGVESCHALGMLDEDDYQQYRTVNDSRLKKEKEERDRKQKAREDAAIEKKRAEDYKKYTELKTQFEQTK